MASSIRVQPVHAITPWKTSFLNVQAMKSNRWTWTLKGIIPESMWLKEVGLSVWLMTTAEFRKFESSRAIEFEKSSYHRRWNLVEVQETLSFLSSITLCFNSEIAIPYRNSSASSWKGRKIMALLYPYKNEDNSVGPKIKKIAPNWWPFVKVIAFGKA